MGLKRKASYFIKPISSTVQRNFMIAMYVIFLGIIPSILLIMFIFYYSRHNVLLWWKRPRKSYVNYFNCCNNKRNISDKFQSLKNLIGISHDELSAKPVRKFNKDDIQVSEPKSSISVPKSSFSVSNSPFSLSKTTSGVHSVSKSPYSVSISPPFSVSPHSVSKSPHSVSTSPPFLSKSTISDCKSSKVQINNSVLKNNEPIYSNTKQFSKDDIQITLSASKSTIRNGNVFNLVKSNEELSKSRIKPIKIIKDDIQIKDHFGAKNNEEQICLETKKKQLRKVNKDHILTLSATGTKANSINSLVGNKEQNSIVKNQVRKFTKDDIVGALSDDVNTKVSKENKPNLVIIKQGLASTTNERINKSFDRTGNGIYVNL